MIATADWTAWTCRVRLAVTEPAALDDARAIVAGTMADVDRAASRFRADSELVRLDRTAGTWTAVSPLLTALLAVALRAAVISDGDVDPTVGSALVGLGYDRSLAEVPAGGPVLTADGPVLTADGPVLTAAAPGWQSVELDQAGCRVRVAPGVRLDLGATAKAWTADTAAAAIAERSGAGCLVSIGGDVAVAGPAPAGGWRVRIEDVTGDPDRPAAGPVVRISDGGLATSSITARRWHRAGLDLHHLIDPRTGFPPAPSWRTVTAAAGSCVDANIVTTAAIVRGTRVWPWLRRTGVPVRLVSVDGAVHAVNGWPPEEDVESRPSGGTTRGSERGAA